MNEKVNRKVLKASGIVAIVMVGALLVVGALELVVLGMKSRLDYLGAGERWSSDGQRYAVISLYAEDEAGLTADDVAGWTRRMDSELLEAAVTPKEGARSWAFCFAADDMVTVTGPKASCTAKTLAVGGDFFLFHQLSFTYGSGFLNDDSNPMGVVLDRDTAWRTFGAENVVGMTVDIGGEEFVVVGIAQKESDAGPYEYAYGDTPRMYMSYAGYSKIASKSVTLFEAALPNAVKGFALNIFGKAVSTDPSRTVVLEATDRFSLNKRLENMKQLSYAWVSVNRIEFPYWENEARVYDYRAAVIMIFEIAFAAVAVISLLLSFILLRASGYTLTQSVKNAVKKLSEKREARKKEQPPKPEKTKKKKTKQKAEPGEPGIPEQVEVINENP
ncbi:MAG: ABC transporter permease [Clostridia bacterium]|nr:ABC transporter permease [Clostridia bacterium]